MLRYVQNLTRSALAHQSIKIIQKRLNLNAIFNIETLHNENRRSYSL